MSQIGTGHVPSNDRVAEVIEVIKSCIGKKDIIYGGSVNSENIENFLNLSGVLIGSASLDFDHFYKIIRQVNFNSSINN